jgi:hypothetical protein
VPLAVDEGLAGFALRLQRIEFLAALVNVYPSGVGRFMDQEEKGPFDFRGRR